MKTHPAWIAQTRIETPWGAMRLARSRLGLAGAWLPGQTHEPPPFEALPEEPGHPWFLAAAQALHDWVREDPAELPPLDPQGTAFQLAVWQQLRRIPRGSSTSYGEIAQALGNPTAGRAVGAAVGRNPIGILVPCHRVIGRDGSLTGYAGGLALKTQLLRAEGLQLGQAGGRPPQRGDRVRAAQAAQGCLL